MPLPETIPAKYSEDEASSISMRPLVRQTFRAAELVDMIVSVAGKDSHRVQQILRSGTIVFHAYRYWWQGFEPDLAALADLLARYPDPDPARPFRPQDCTEVILESSGTLPRHSLRLRREEAARKRLFRARSLWDALLTAASEAPPHYREYSYAQRADIYAAPLDAAALTRLTREAAQYSPRSLRAQLTHLASMSQIVFVCPRLITGAARLPGLAF
ncbi:MAG: hypothetical protein WB780_20945 [Candidatus Acidiferrales bacterium]